MDLTDILVLSGSDAVISLIVFSLGSYWGVLIRRTDSCDLALQKAAERKPQAVVVDVDTPGAEGCIRTLSESGILVIAVNDQSGWAVGAGASETIPPPFQPARLRQAIERVSKQRAE